MNASQSGSSPPQDWIEEKLQEVCDDLGITRDGHLNRKKLVSICEQYGLQNVDGEVSSAVHHLGDADKAELATGWKLLCRGFLPLATEIIFSSETFSKILCLRNLGCGKAKLTVACTGCIPCAKL